MMAMRDGNTGGATAGWRLIAALLTGLWLAGCNLLPEVKEETAGWSAERLYTTAHDEMMSGNYTRAIKLFETLEARYPYGRHAQQAVLEGGYANYRSGETAKAQSPAAVQPAMGIRLRPQRLLPVLRMA